MSFRLKELKVRRPLPVETWSCSSSSRLSCCWLGCCGIVSFVSFVLFVLFALSVLIAVYCVFELLSLQVLLGETDSDFGGSSLFETWSRRRFTKWMFLLEGLFYI